LPLEGSLGLLQGRTGALLSGLRLVKLDLVGLGFDREQERAFLDQRTILIVDLLHEAGDARHEIGGIHRGRVTRRLQISRHRLL